MSEEEILQGIDDLKHTGCLTEYGIKIINGILDLYNKEKNEEIEATKKLQEKSADEVFEDENYIKEFYNKMGDSTIEKM